MAMDMTARKQLAEVLDWRSAHVGFDDAVKGIPPKLRGAVPPGFAHSAWQLVEHMRIAQHDILDFAVNARYKAKKWPDDYWPKSPQPGNAAAWAKSIAGFRRDRRAMQRLARNPRIDLTAKIPHGTGQTSLRQILLVADHTAHHLGQLIDVRRALGNWKPVVL
jgi:uncharacterized damage-inducible protein DinB